MNYNKKSYIYFALSLLFSQVTLGKKFDFSIKPRSEKKHLQNYLGIHKKFSKLMCSSGEEQQFNKLNKNFRGLGNFVPLLDDNRIDKFTVKNSIPIIKEKISWLKALEEKAKTLRVGQEIRKIDRLENQLKKLVKLKSDWLKGKSGAYLKYKNYEKTYRKDVISFLESFHLIQSFRFPINHLELRRTYDILKMRKDDEGKGAANKIYLYRQLVEDGAQDRNHTRSDKFLRSLSDRLWLELSSFNTSFEEDHIRYDLEDFFKWSRNLLSRGRAKQVERIKEWSKRTKEALVLYESLLEENLNLGNRIVSEKKFLGDKAHHRYNLKKFVLSKQALVYDFWSKQSKLNQALFAMETILYNEVGALDVAGGLERKDVSQIVLNRRFDEQYSHLDLEGGLYPYLPDTLQASHLGYPWLNVLFKRGEFSFTYFFIPSSVRIFCPDMSKRGRGLRKENVRISLRALSKPRFQFDAVRYFSRGSMLGRIPMSSLWDDHQPVGEMPGLKMRHYKKYKRAMKKDTAELLYSFQSGVDQRDYTVYRFKKKLFVTAANNKEFYHYRNPHYFSYFREKAPREEVVQPPNDL